MTRPDMPREPEQLSCDVCCKEIPVSEASSEEAVDYVLHFCGVDCYAHWRARGVGQRQEGGAAAKAAPDAPIELSIVWQRLVADNRGTCARCEATGEALQRALETLKEVLSPLGVRPVLHTEDIDIASFKVRPMESNRVWIDGTPLEAWIGAEVGRSQCCDVCGDAECRTLDMNGRVYEAVPDMLIVKAALMAAARLLIPPAATPVAAASA